MTLKLMCMGHGMLCPYDPRIAYVFNTMIRISTRSPKDPFFYQNPRPQKMLESGLPEILQCCDGRAFANLRFNQELIN
jgi:hypothetical protein